MQGGPSMPELRGNTARVMAPIATRFGGMAATNMETITPSSYAAIGIGVSPPSQADNWNPPSSFHAGTLDNPMPSGPITQVASWNVNASIPVSRRVIFLPEFTGIRGAIGANMIGLIYKGYVNPFLEMNRFTHNNQRLENNSYSTPYKDVLVTMPMANQILIDLASRAQSGETTDEYTTDFVNSKFFVDGVIETITGDEQMPISRGYGAREASAAVLRSGRLLTKNIWDLAMQPGVPLCIGLKKFDPAAILHKNIPYSVDPASVSDGKTMGVLEKIKNENELSDKKTWVYQYIALPPQVHGFNISFTEYESKLCYADENGIFRCIEPIQIGIVERATTYSSTIRSFVMDVPTERVTSTAKLASAPTVDLYVNVC